MLKDTTLQKFLTIFSKVDVVSFVFDNCEATDFVQVCLISYQHLELMGSNLRPAKLTDHSSLNKHIKVAHIHKILRLFTVNKEYGLVYFYKKLTIK